MHHLWYLSEDLARLILRDDKVPKNPRRAAIEKLKRVLGKIPKRLEWKIDLDSLRNLRFVLIKVLQVNLLQLLLQLGPHHSRLQPMKTKAAMEKNVFK